MEEYNLPYQTHAQGSVLRNHVLSDHGSTESAFKALEQMWDHGNGHGNGHGDGHHGDGVEAWKKPIYMDEIWVLTSVSRRDGPV